MSCNPEGRGGAEVGEEGGSRREASCKVEQDRCKGSREEATKTRRPEWSKMRWTEKEEHFKKGESTE